MTDELEIKKIVGQIAAAYFGNSHVTPNEIPVVINQIANSIAAVGAAAPAPEAETAEPAKLTPAQIRKSITREAIISFEDGKSYKTMRRHLAARGLTPDDYRSKWGLPRDYPMVAPAYSEARSNLAKERGLGGRVRASSSAEAPARGPRGPRRAAAQAAPAPAVRGAKRRGAAAKGKDTGE